MQRIVLFADKVMTRLERDGRVEVYYHASSIDAPDDFCRSEPRYVRLFFVSPESTDSGMFYIGMGHIHGYGIAEGVSPEPVWRPPFLLTTEAEYKCIADCTAELDLLDDRQAIKIIGCRDLLSFKTDEYVGGLIRIKQKRFGNSSKYRLLAFSEAGKVQVASKQIDIGPFRALLKIEGSRADFES